MPKPISALFITNIPVPYREKIHEIVASHEGINYSVFYCSKIEPNRQWKIQFGNYQKELLEEKSFSFHGSKVYFGGHIIRKLRKLNPDVIILGGLSPTMIYSYIWAKINGKKCIFFSDSHLEHERNLGFFHKALRHIFYSKSSIFIGPSQKTKALFSHYAHEINFFQSHLCANNAHYRGSLKKLTDRNYDFMFSGQITDIKMPFFFTEVIQKIQQIKNIKVLVIGDGPDRDIFIDSLKKTGASVEYPGFIEQKLLPEYYANAKVLLFPSKGDAWGIVANEALAAGTPVITSPEAGVANELVVQCVNGYVLPINADLWATHALNLIHNNGLWNQMSSAAVESIAGYSYENAANGIIQAIEYAAQSKRSIEEHRR